MQYTKTRKSMSNTGPSAATTKITRRKNVHFCTIT